MDIEPGPIFDMELSLILGWGQFPKCAPRITLCILKVPAHKNKTFEFNIIVLGSIFRLLPANMCQTGILAIYMDG